MVKIYSKITLGKELQKKVLDHLNDRGGHTYTLNDLEFIIDESILSGIRIDENSEITDLTLNNRIHQILDILQ